MAAADAGDALPSAGSRRLPAREVLGRRAALRARPADQPDPRPGPRRRGRHRALPDRPSRRPADRRPRPRRQRRATSSPPWSPIAGCARASAIASRTRRSVGDRAARSATRAARRDLTAEPTFTVDPATARDFDDAVSAKREGDGFRLWIHIADVAAHVKPDSGLDREALARANSTYAPGIGQPDAAAVAQQRRLQPQARGRAPRGDRRDRALARRGGEVDQLLPLADPLRRAPRLRRPRPDLLRARAALPSRSPTRSTSPAGRPARSPSGRRARA